MKMGRRSIVLLFSLVLEVWSDSSLGNETRVTLPGIDEYRSALTLDSLGIEDLKQRELHLDPTTEFTEISVITKNCLVNPRPSYAKVTKLMLELFRNLERNNGLLESDLKQMHFRLKLLMKFSMLDSESDSTSLTEKPKILKHEIHATFSRILAMLWLEITDSSTTWNNNWCPMKKVTEYVKITDPVDIAKHLRELKPLLAQVRDIMEEFIQSITPPSHLKTILGQKVFEKDNFSVGNMTGASLSEIEAYRSALNLDWKAAASFRQRDLVPVLSAKTDLTKCNEYPKPSFEEVAKLMFELLMHLEGEDGIITPDLIRVLMKSKLLLENPMRDTEKDMPSNTGTPKIVVGDSHYTLSRILAAVWIIVSDITLTSTTGWCPIVSMNEYLASTNPNDIEKNLHVLGPLVARARFIMEEFIQTISPLNIYQEEPTAPGPTQLARLAHQETEVLWGYTGLRPLRTSTEILHVQHDDYIQERYASKATVDHVSSAILTVLLLFYEFY